MSGRDHHWVRIGRVEKVVVTDCGDFDFIKIKETGSDWWLCLKFSKLGSSKSANDTYTASVVFGDEASSLILKNDVVAIDRVELRLKRSHRSYFYVAVPTTENKLAHEIVFSAWQPSEYVHANQLKAISYQRWLEQYQTTLTLDFSEEAISKSLLPKRAPEMEALDNYIEGLYLKCADMLDDIGKTSVGCRVLASWLNETELDFAKQKQEIGDAKSWALIFLFSQLLRKQVCYAVKKRAHYRESTFASMMESVMEEALECYLDWEQSKDETSSIQ